MRDVYHRVVRCKSDYESRLMKPVVGKVLYTTPIIGNFAGSRTTLLDKDQLKHAPDKRSLFGEVA